MNTFVISNCKYLPAIVVNHGSGKYCLLVFVCVSVCLCVCLCAGLSGLSLFVGRCSPATGNYLVGKECQAAMSAMASPPWPGGGDFVCAVSVGALDVGKVES